MPGLLDDVVVEIVALGLGDLKLNAADIVDKIRHAEEVDADKILDIQLEGVVDGGDGQLRPAIEIGMAHLGIAVAHLDIQVALQRHHLDGL